MAVAGDRIEVPSKRVGQAPREGVVVATSGSLLRVRWASGEESTIMPSMGSVLVVGKARAGGRKSAAGKQPAAPKPGSGESAGRSTRPSAKSAKASSGARRPKIGGKGSAKKGK